jgi:hypothetical protein|tara:strand:+ start:650 stop:802 length:153 start_codon:yes stop_codon:yes gene_type:complete
MITAIGGVWGAGRPVVAQTADFTGVADDPSKPEIAATDVTLWWAWRRLLA